MKKLEDREWWSEMVQLKDVLSLRELAERYDVAPAAISNALKRNNLARNAAPPGPRAKREEGLLQRAQEAISRLNGSPVSSSRRSRGPRSSAPVASSRSPSDNVGDRNAWRVTFETAEFIVLAEDIVSAARAASSSGKGGVTRIEFVGRAIVG